MYTIDSSSPGVMTHFDVSPCRCQVLKMMSPSRWRQENLNTRRIPPVWRAAYAWSFHTGGSILWCHISHWSYLLDGVTLFLCVIKVRKRCKHLRYSQTFGGIFSAQWRKVGRIWRIQLLFHHSLCVRIDIDQL